MTGVVVGFGIIAVVIAAGYLIARVDLLGADGQRVLSRLAFSVLTPCLLFADISRADIDVLVSPVLVDTAAAALVCATLSVVLLRVVLHKTVPETTMATFTGAYVNSNNIGLPVAVYVLGSATFVAPVLVFQLVVLTPITLLILDWSTTSRPRASLARSVGRPFTNPLLVMTLAGVVCCVFRVTIPVEVREPISLVGSAAVPVVLLSYGMSLRGRIPFGAGSDRPVIVAESLIKVVLMPAVAWFLGAAVLHFDRTTLFVAVVVAGLPSAQNAYVYAQRYQVGVGAARDTVLITTVAAVPILAGVAALLR